MFDDAAREVARPDPYIEGLWAVFDLVAAEIDPAEAERIGEKGMEQIGLSRGVSESSLRKFRQRGRALARYRDEIAKLPRWKSPMSLVQAKERETARSASPATDLDLTLINAVLASNRTTQEAVVELVRTGRLSTYA